MTEFTSYEPGTPNWVELVTTDAAGAKAFYMPLFQWETQDLPAGEDSVYTMWLLRGKQVGAMYQMGEGESSMGVPPHWRTYISVADADAVAEQAKTLGGQVLMEPADVFDAGRMALIQDPTGAVFAIWQPRNHLGAQLANEPGTLVWNELATKDRAAATAFYTQLFGWQAQTNEVGGMVYTSFLRGDWAVVVMLEMDEQWGEMASHWAVYLGVADSEAGRQQARDLGGQVHVDCQEIPDIGRFSLIQDPQGAMFYIIQLNEWPQ